LRAAPEGRARERVQALTLFALRALGVVDAGRAAWWAGTGARAMMPSPERRACDPGGHRLQRLLAASWRSR